MRLKSSEFLVVAAAGGFYILFNTNQSWFMFWLYSYLTSEVIWNVITIQSIFIKLDATAPASIRLLHIDFATSVSPHISSCNTEPSPIVSVQTKMLTIMTSKSEFPASKCSNFSPRWAGNSCYWFWMFQFHTKASENRSSTRRAIQHGGPLGSEALLRKSKHYPLWPCWPSAWWVDGTSSCFWVPPDKLTLW